MPPSPSQSKRMRSRTTMDLDLTATAEVTANAESVVASSTVPLTRRNTEWKRAVTLTLNGGIYESQYTVGNNMTVFGYYRCHY